jgi:hypothetical protein
VAASFYFYRMKEISTKTDLAIILITSISVNSQIADAEYIVGEEMYNSLPSKALSDGFFVSFKSFKDIFFKYMN